MNMKSIFIILKSISIACVFVLCVCGYLNYYSQPENSKQRWLQSEGPIDPELETAVMDQLFEFPLSDVTLKTIWVHVPEWEFASADSSDAYIEMHIEVSKEQPKDKILENLRHTALRDRDKMLSESDTAIEILSYRCFIPNSKEGGWTQYACFSSNHVIEYRPDVFPLEVVLIPGFILYCALLFLPYRKIFHNLSLRVQG